MPTVARPRPALRCRLYHPRIEDNRRGLADLSYLVLSQMHEQARIVDERLEATRRQPATRLLG